MRDFGQLSPIDFEDLTQDLLQREWGIRLEAFKVGRDGGIDLRCSLGQGGSLVVQCKHFGRSGLRALLAHLRREEAPKVRRLAPARYVLVTSVPLSPANKAEIRGLLSPHLLDEADVLGCDDVENLLRRHPEVEEANFKLWLTSTRVLQRVLHNAERLNAEMWADRVRANARLYVRSPAFGRALEVLERERVLVISGVPGVGKTTLADMLLMAHLEQGFEPVVVHSDIAEAKRLFSRGRKQAFYFDDFLGATFLGPRSDLLGRRHDEALVSFADLVAQSPSKRFILTTREHLLMQAFRVSERLERHARSFAMRRCVLEIGDYGLLDRARILYNHVHFSDLEPAHRAEMLSDEFYLEVLRHRNFNPRLVEWLSHLANVRDEPATGYKHVVRRVLENPTGLWRAAFENQLSEAARSLLLALYALGGSATVDGDLRLAWEALHRHRMARYNLPATAEDWRGTLRELDGGLVSFAHGHASFVNPSVKDFFDATLCEHPDHALDVLESAQTFKPIEGVWALAASARGGPLLRHLAREQRVLELAVTRALASPVARELVTDEGQTLWTRADVAAEARLLAVARMAGVLKSKELARLADAAAGALADSWEKFTPDYEALVAVEETFERHEAFWQHSALPRSIWALAVDMLATNPSHISGFLALAQHATEREDRLRPDSRSLLRDAFERYLDDGFWDDLGDASSENSLDELSGHLEIVGKWLDADVEDATTNVAERVEELRREPEADDGPVRTSWASRPSADRQSDEDEVRRLFGGLPTRR